MSDASSGGFEYDGRGYRFRRSRADWRPGGFLTIEAKGDRCGLSLIGIPFPSAAAVSDLPGRIWDPDAGELSRYADTFAEGGLEVRGRRLWIMRGRIECRKFDPEREVLTVSFRLAVQDGEYGREDEADGVVYCEV